MKIRESDRRWCRENLSPCPFCGGTPLCESWHGGKPTKRRVGCDNDECRILPSVTGETRQEAKRYWNTRSLR